MKRLARQRLSVLLALAILATAAIAVGAASTADPADAQGGAIEKAITFYENFDDFLPGDGIDQPLGWTRAGSSNVTWKIHDQAVSGGVEQMLKASRTTSSGQSTYHTGNNGWSDYELDFTVKPTETGTVGVNFRYIPETNSYYRYTFSSSGTSQLVSVTNGGQQVLHNGSVGYQLNTEYEVNVRAVGSSLQVRIDGNLVANVNNTAHKQGRIGLFANTKGVLFDSVKVEATAHHGFTIAVLPDTQGYVADVGGAYHEYFVEQTKWIAENRAAEKIVAVIHEGDIVNQPICPTEHSQWAKAKEAMDYIRGRVPVVIAAGNHDVITYSESGHPCGASSTHYVGSQLFDQTFPKADYDLLGTVKGMYSDSSGWFPSPGRMDNHYQTFEAGGVKILAMTLTFGPRTEMLTWANNVINQNSDHEAILVTHDYLGDDNGYRGMNGSNPCTTNVNPCDALPGGYNGGGGGGATTFPWTPRNGKQIYDGLVKNNTKIRMVLNGHVASCHPTDQVGPYNRCDFTAGRRTEFRYGGSRVFSMLSNFQTWSEPLLAGDPDTGGSGYMRLLEIMPKGSKIDSVRARTFSPSFPSRPIEDAENAFVVQHYSDISDGHAFTEEINEARHRGILYGFSDNTFQPMANLERQAAALMIWRASPEYDGTEGDCTSNGLTSAFPNDVPNSSQFCAAIRKMRDAERINSSPTGQFRPADPVSRRAIAAFMFPPIGICPVGTPAPFSDIPRTDGFCKSIKAAKDAPVIEGYSDGTFQPDNPVSRQAGAAMSVRFFHHTH